MNYQNICEELCAIAKQAAAFIRKEYPELSQKDIRFKDKNDLVSYVDIETEKLLKTKLGELLPGSEFLAEESFTAEDKTESEYLWIIDPLDGTTNFIHHIPVFSISIALAVNNEIKAGVVYEIMQDECFYSWEGGPAFMNGKLIQVAESNGLSNSLIATGFPYKNFEIMDNYLSIFRYLMLNTRGLRRLGSAAVDLAYVACGRFDGFFEFNLSPWDVAAGSFIVKQAGGIVTDFHGGENYLHGKQIIAASKNVYTEFFEALVKNKFN